MRSGYPGDHDTLTLVVGVNGLSLKSYGYGSMDMR